MNQFLDLLLIQSRQMCTRDDIIELAQTFDGGVHGGKRVVTSKEQLVPNAILLNKHQTVVELERSIVQCADIGVNVWMLANHGDALALIRMRNVRHNDLHVWMSDSNCTEISGEGAFKRRLADERRTGVQQDRHSLLLGINPELIEPQIVRPKG